MLGVHQTQLGTAQRSTVGLPSYRPATRKKEHKVFCELGGSYVQEPRWPNPWTGSMAIDMDMEYHLIGGMKPSTGGWAV